MRFLVLAVTGFIALATAVSAETTDRTVKANGRSALGGFLGYEVDTCYPSQIPAVKIRQKPSYGTLQIVPHEQVLGKDNRCPNTKVRGLAYIYTPDKGFKGADEVSIDIPWSSTDSGPETLMTQTYRIRVE
ncbi:hypothetical protein [Microvirga antarctica]|uniref:hypothetical protein n=1 Tax=Microvirga antarctica TaxID=2819233 RepID=UPI001B307446|nr:hypothetical protein [Microvirga antarctica]